MIVLNLSCDREHQFEGWFASADAFESQREQGLVSCPVCASTAITKRPSAPYVNTRAVAPMPRKAAPDRGEPADPATQLTPDVVATVLATMRRMARESEDVGKQFPEEARRIHYGESQARNIKGQASGDEVRELIDEGIMVLPLPADDGVH